MKAKNSIRYSVLGAIFVLIGIVIVSQLVRFQVGEQAKIFREHGERIAGESYVITPVRGQIYDRWGHLLAGNEIVYEVGVDLINVENPETIALAASVVLKKDYGDVYRLVSQEASIAAVHVMLERFASAQQVEQLQMLAEQINENPEANGTTEDGEAHSLAGLTYDSHLRRTYPEKSLAANVLGFVNMDLDGNYGVEGHFDELLAGVEEQVYWPYDPNRALELPEPPEGADIILTIDREIQSITEKILDDAVQNNGAYAGTILVMQPETGEILAMASNPRINLNEFGKLHQVYQDDQFFNLALGSYEPGSVFKVLTMAAALDSETVNPDTVFIDTGQIVVGEAMIYNWNRGAWGPQDMTGCLQHSLNVCLAWLSTEMGPSIFYKYMQQFGLGHSTGIELETELPGTLKLPGDSNWYESDLGTNAFGQGIAVTPVQMLMAISAVANEGKMVVPRVLHAVVDNNRQYNAHPQIVGTPISTETAQILTEMLATSLEGEASSALVPGYRVAGKTGTAEIPTPYGYTSGVTHTSFVGWGPTDNPQFLVYIWLDKPTSSMWGSEVAAPIFSDVVQRLVVLMGIPPDHIRLSTTAP